MTCFVVCRNLLILFRNLTGFLFRTYNNLHCCFFDFGHSNCHKLTLCRKKGCFIEKIFKVCTCKSNCCCCNLMQVDIGCQRFISCVNLKNILSALNVGITNCYLTVKTTRTKKCRVKDIRTVSSSNNDYAFVCTEAIHFNKQLVKGLFTFVVSTTHTGASVTTHSINFVNKDD